MFYLLSQLFQRDLPLARTATRAVPNIDQRAFQALDPFQ